MKKMNLTIEVDGIAVSRDYAYDETDNTYDYTEIIIDMLDTVSRLKNF